MGSNRPLGAHIAVKRLIFSTSRWWHRVQGRSHGLRYIFNALRFDIVASVYLIEPKVPFSMEVACVICLFRAHKILCAGKGTRQTSDLD